MNSFIFSGSRFTLFWAILGGFYLVSCSGIPTKNPAPKTIASQELLSKKNLKNPIFSQSFGELEVRINSKPTKKTIYVFFEDNQIYSVSKDGSLVVALKPGLTHIDKIHLKNSKIEYKLSSLAMSSGPPGSQTYFGKITIDIVLPEKSESLKGVSDPLMRWTWSAENRWKQTWAFWKKKFGNDFEKAFFSLAEKTGPINLDLQSRGIATDREDVVTGF